MATATITPPSMAQEGPPHPKQAIRLEVDGEDGVWLPLELSKEVQLDAERAPVLAAAVEGLELKLSIRGERLMGCKESVRQLQSLVIRADQRLTELKQYNAKWYRKPGVWVGVGVVATVILEVAVVSIFKVL